MVRGMESARLEMGLGAAEVPKAARTKEKRAALGYIMCRSVWLVLRMNVPVNEV